MCTRKEWKRGSGDRLLKKNNSKSNLKMMSFVGMNLHEERMEKREW
jgi:hypothetical protein